MSIQVKLCRNWVIVDSPTKRYIRVRINAPPAVPKEISPMALAFVIDTSGSMGGQKLTYAKLALQEGLKCLRPQDTFSVTRFSDNIERVLESQKATPENVDAAVRSIEALRANGSTHLSGGWFDGFAALRDADAVNKRVLLLSDGQANRGLMSPRDLLEMSASGLTAGVQTSAFGVGEGFDEHTMEGMAHHGGGNFVYIERAKNIHHIMKGQILEGLNISLRNVSVEIVAPPGFNGKMTAVARYLSDYTRGRLLIQAGHLTDRQRLDLFVEVELGAMPPDDPRVFKLRVFDETGDYDESAELSFVGRPKESQHKPTNSKVLFSAFELKRSLAILEASKLNARQDFEEAHNLLRAFAREVFELYSETRIEKLAELYETVIRDSERYRRNMESSVRKMEHSVSVYHARSRSSDNRSIDF